MNVGDTVFVSTRRGFYTAKIKRIGRNCFYLDGPSFQRKKYHIDSLWEADSIGTADKVYLTRQEYDNALEKGRLISVLNGYSWHTVDLKILKQTEDILNG